MAKASNLQRMIKISKYYYEDNLTQDEIARKMNISVPQVSRIVNAAKNQGYVKTFVMDPFSEVNDLSKQLISTFHIRDARIVESRANDRRLTQTGSAQAGADYLLGIIQSNDVISIAFCDTTSKIPQFLPKMHIENISFVQPNGTVFEHVQGFQNDTVRETGLKLDGYYYYFPAPAIVKDKYTRDALHEDPSIKWVLEKAKMSNIAIFSVTQQRENSIYVKNRYLRPEELEKLYEKGAVGDIFGHFIDLAGRIVEPDLEDRIIGMDISELRTKDYSICISAGDHLAEAIYATLAGGYCNVLITDTVTAKRLIEMESAHHES